LTRSKPHRERSRRSTAPRSGGVVLALLLQDHFNLNADAKRQLLELIQGAWAGEAGIVYCQSRKKVEQVADWLVARGLTALPYHAGMEQKARARNQHRFITEDGIIMVATIAFGMGIDKPDVRFVAHLDLPSSVEAYYQETGRAGRDGAPAEAWLAFGLQDVVLLRRRIEDSDLSEERKTVSRRKLAALLAFCEATQCRRVELLRYLGEESAPCGNCDICLEPGETWDATVPAQKLLSACWRTGQRFGIGHLIDVLRGEGTEKVLRFGHQQLPVFGIGTELDVNGWKALARQLLSLGYLYVQSDEFNTLAVAETARPLLKGETQLLLRRPTIALSRSDRRRRDPLLAAMGEVDAKLFDALRARRRDLAAAQNVPPYVIFHDATLREIAARRPQDLDAFLAIPGIGERKLKRYGADFLEVLAAFA